MSERAAHCTLLSSDPKAGPTRFHHGPSVWVVPPAEGIVDPEHVLVNSKRQVWYRCFASSG
eukprot:13110853-Alexandrium_andersonii.AAC.1